MQPDLPLRLNRTEMMFDIETLGTRSGCVVLSFAAVVYGSAKGDITVGLTHALSIPEQLRRGAFVDPATSEWWASQPDAAWAGATSEAKAVAYAVKALDDMVAKHKPERIYCQGMDFDFPIFADLRRRFGLGIGWDHWRQRDTRTAYEEHGFDPKSMPRKGVHHNAIDDCGHQIACLTAARNGGSV